MSRESDLTIHDLTERSGLSPRSIHHYISRGLLPGPEGSGPAARYGLEHLLRLKLIEHAKAANFRIDQKLQEALDGLSLEEMEELAERAQSASPEDVRQFGQWLLTGGWRPSPRKPPRASLRDRLPSTARLLSAELPEEAVASADPEPSLHRPEPWQRYRVGEGLEISWRQRPGDPEFERKVRGLLAFARKLFGRWRPAE